MKRRLEILNLKVILPEQRSDFKNNPLETYTLVGSSQNGQTVIEKSTSYKVGLKFGKDAQKIRAENHREARFLLSQWYYTHVKYFEQMRPSLFKWFIGTRKPSAIIDGWIIINFRQKHYIYFHLGFQEQSSKLTPKKKKLAQEAIENAKDEIAKKKFNDDLRKN